MSEVFLAEYGRAKTINFALYEVDGVDLRVDAVDAGADCSIMKDEGAEGTCTNDFVDEGQGYSLALTATEMQAARATIYVVDSATKVWLDRVIHIETFGHQSAAHPNMSPYWANGAVNDGSATDTSWTFDGFTEATADHVIGSELIFTSGANAGQCRTVTDYTSTVITVAPALLAAPADNDEFVLRAKPTTSAGQVPAVDLAANKVIAVDWTNGGRLDLLLDAIPTTAMRGTDNAALASVLGALNDAAAADDPTTADTVMQYVKQAINIFIGAAGIANLRAAAAPANAVSLSEMIRAIYDDTNELQADDIPGKLPAALVGGRMDSDQGAKTGNVALSAQEKLDVNTEVDTGFTTQMADSVPADGTIATREQAMYIALQMFTEFSFSGTTMTVKKVDGTTTLITLTLDDDTIPTSLTRAT